MKKDVVRDIKFLKKCREYGLNWNMVEVYNYDDEKYLYIPTIDMSHIIIMDSSYTVIGIEKRNLNRLLTDIIDVISPSFVLFKTCLIVVGIGTVVGMIGSGRAVRKYLKV